MRRSSLSFVVLAVSACGSDGSVGGATLEITPAELRVTIVDDQPIVQPYTATLTLSDGTQQDVSDQVSFSVANMDIGTWDGPRLSLSGMAVGETRVTAQLGDTVGEAALTVYASTSHFDFGVPRASRSIFADAITDPTCGPQLAYPRADAVIPRNIGMFDVAWTDTRDDLFEVRIASTYREVRVYTRGSDPAVPFTSAIAATDWQRIVAEPGPVTLRVSGVIETDAMRACTYTQPLRLSDHAISGAIYVWTPGAGVLRHDLSAIDDVMLPIGTSLQTLIPVIGEQNDEPMSCEGCAFSREGTRLALPVDPLGYGWIYDFVLHTRVAPGNFSDTITWQSAAFPTDDTRLLIEQAGQLRLVTDLGQPVATMPVEGGTFAHQPAFSPDGRRLAYIQERAGDTATTLVARSYDGGTASFDETGVIVATETGVVVGSPAWSPDGQWLAYTRITAPGTAEARAALWVVKADGTGMPIRITEPTDQLDVEAHWAPADDTVGGERFYYLTYASTAPVDLYATGMQQIVVQPFFPARGQTASPVRLPFQDRGAPFHVAEWTRSMVN